MQSSWCEPPTFCSFHYTILRPASGTPRSLPSRTSTSPAGRPIPAAIPAGDTRELLSRAPSVTCCPPKDVEAIARSIESAVDAWRGHGTHHVDRSAFMAPYERRELSRQLAGVFDEVIGRRDR